MSSIAAVRRCTGAGPCVRKSVPTVFARRMCLLLVVSAMAVVLPQARAQSCGVGETAVAFGHTGGIQTVVVPAGVHSARVHLSGAQGGAGRSGAGTIGGSPLSPGGAGGLGGRVSGTLAVAPGTMLAVGVGGQGTQAVNPGGLGNGVDGIGGGATDLRVGGSGVDSRVAVAGGGGGGGNAGWSTSEAVMGGAGGAGGGGAGGSGAAVPSGSGPFGGGGGTVGSGGAPGGGCGTFPATAGNAANGNGGSSFNFSGSFSGAGFGGGGGGGATVGAGGGGAGVGTTGCQQNWNGGGGGGAGGSSAATGMTAVVIDNGVHAGNGSALICFAPSQFSVGGTASGQTGPVTLQLAGTNPASTQQVVVAQAAATFAFPTLLPQGANWSVSVLGAPAGQTCSVSPASGALIAADVTNLALTCTTVVVTLAPATLPDGGYGNAYSQALSASSANGATAPYTFSISAGALPAGVSLSAAGVLSGTPTATGSFNFTVQAASSNGFNGTRAYTLAIAQASQAISAVAANPAAPVFAPGGTFTLSATGGASGNPIVFASTTPAVCTVAGSTATMLSAGTCSLTANQAGDANHSAAPQVTLDVAIGSAAQSITGFAASVANPVFAPGGTFTLSATGGASGNPVAFASTTPTVCTVAGNTVTMVSAGLCSLTADQAGNAGYSAAPQVVLAVSIAQASQGITGFAANPANPVYTPGGTFSVSATPGASSSPLVFGSTTPSVCTVSGNSVAILAAGACTLTADQAGDGSYEAAPRQILAVAIAAATQEITAFASDPANPVYAPGGTFSVSATPGASSSPLAFGSTTPSVCTVAGSTVTILTAGACGLTADQAADGNYDAAPQAVLSVAIAAAAQEITAFASDPATPVYAPNGTFSVSATPGASSSPLVFGSTTPSVCTVTGNTVTMVSAGSCALTADQAGDGNYEAAARVTLAVAIAIATPVLDWVEDLVKVYGEPDFELPLPTSSSPGAFTFTSSNASVATIDGRMVGIEGAGVTVLTAHQAATTNYAAATISMTLTVADRPDPTRDASVIEGLQAQADASVRFADAQQSNVRNRLRQLRHARGTPSSNDLSVSVHGGNGPGLSMPLGAGVGGGAPREDASQRGVWAAGSIFTGNRDGRGGGGFDLQSDGITVGTDREFNRFVLGVAAGAGWSDVEFADDRSSQDATQRSLMFYGLWRGGEHWYFDGMFGVGRLDFDLKRWSASASALATARRDGDQFFGSSSVGYTHSGRALDITGYGRLDFSRTSLGAYRESGLGIYDLDYRVQTIESQTAAIGIEGSHRLELDGRGFRPFWSLEYRDALRNASDVRINYVVRPASSDYRMGVRTYADDLWAVSAGFDLELPRRWQASFQFRREQGSGFGGNGVLFQLSRGGLGMVAPVAPAGDDALQTGIGGGTGTGR